MKGARVFVFLLAACLAAPAGARPLTVSHRGTTIWIRAWNGFVGYFRGFQLFDAMEVSGHGFPPPPSCPAWMTIQ
jgi:hypothetical protein